MRPVTRILLLESSRPAGCLDRAIKQTSRGEKLDPKLSAIVDSVLRSSSNENGKLVSGVKRHLAPRKTDAQAMGLALSLRRLDLIEMLYLSSRGPASSSKTTRPVHDESLLRYVLNEIVSGASGNDNLPAEFRQSVSAVMVSWSHKLTSALRSASSSFQPLPRPRLQCHHHSLGAKRCV